MGVEGVNEDPAAYFAQALDSGGGGRLLFESTRDGVLSWNALDAQGILEFRLLRAHAPATKWLPYARWEPGGSTSYNAEGDGVRVDVDVISSNLPFDGIEVRAVDVDLRLIAFSSARPAPASLPYARAAYVLDVPARSQYIVENERGWCSPASLSMIHAYHGIDVSVEQTAREVFDRAYNGTGNWAFNVAYSGRLGLRGVVAHLGNLDMAQRLIERNLPLVLSYSWSAGELPRAPLESSAGHLAVLCGFTDDGDCAINDPAAPNVRVVYPRVALERIWQRSGAIAYIAAPGGVDYAGVLSGT
jgi:Peptidase_C39 like family